jgi:porin
MPDHTIGWLQCGNKARGVATGVVPPEFNGYYFHIAEVGANWTLGALEKPGFFSVGGWRQTGRLSTDDGLIEEDGAEGVYFVGSQLPWYQNPEPVNNAGVSGYVQLG